MFRRLLSMGLIGIALPFVGGCPCCGQASCCTDSAQTADDVWLSEPDLQRAGSAGDRTTLNGNDQQLDLRANVVAN